MDYCDEKNEMSLLIENGRVCRWHMLPTDCTDFIYRWHMPPTDCTDLFIDIEMQRLRSHQYV